MIHKGIPIVLLRNGDRDWGTERIVNVPDQRHVTTAMSRRKIYYATLTMRSLVEREMFDVTAAIETALGVEEL